jgi:hypothetical protein
LAPGSKIPNASSFAMAASWLILAILRAALLHVGDLTIGDD